MATTDEVAVKCSYCRSAEVVLAGEDAADWLEASDERKPGHLCPTCIETCVAHARQERAHREWLAEGAVR
jgi:hypothetical protein